MTSYLIISRSTPHSSPLSRAALDLAFTAAAFEQEISFVFLNNGVLQLMDDQNTVASNIKNVAKIISALKVYEIKNVYVHQESINQVGLEDQSLVDEFELISNEKLKRLITTVDQVMVF